MIKKAKEISSIIKEEMYHRNFKNLVVGLSGGLDSALSARLAVDAIGNGAVIGYYLPYKDSSAQSRKDSQLMAHILNIRLIELDITPIAEEFAKLLNQRQQPSFGNILSRIRMTLLYDRSYSHQALVLGTSNKSELLLGYNTIYGDSACAINPLGDLYKTDVAVMSEALQLPQEIVRKAPSADYFEGQTDESELGYTYNAIDALLKDYVEKGMTEHELLKKYDKAFVQGIIARVHKMSYKRELPFLISTGQVKIM